jgi:ATP-dependent helicase/nuclease subunit A
MSAVVDLFPARRDDQLEAADPTVSVFVTANAGSGKTKTLIDRVARLLLAKAKPETILCVTYTKAAASEMQRRLYERLGGWSVASDAVLRSELGRLRSRAPESFDAQDLSEARSLFAAALETPGGLKIQTIHAFCEKVLKRFPLERTTC